MMGTRTTVKFIAVFVLAAFASGAGAADTNSRAAGPAQWAGDLTAIGPEQWSYDRAAHLLERAGFGATPEQIASLAAMTPMEAVDRLVDYESIDNGHLAPFVESNIFDPGMMPMPKSRADAVRQGRENGESMGVKVKPSGNRRLQPVVNRFFYGLNSDRLEVRRLAYWWAHRMVGTRRPLEEKMTLFWHGHFATSNVKVRDYRKMRVQLDFLRENATGNFGDLLLGITKDPAMLVFLDNGENVKGRPNENFGREVMELFSMGVGHYTENDIREAARAFTGWTNEDLTFVVRDDLHDDGEKTVLGRSGRFTGEEVIAIILEQPVTAEFIAAKLYRFLVREQIDSEFAGRLGGLLREGDYEFKPFLKTIFLSRDFYSEPSYATQVKSPVHLVVSTYRKLGLAEAAGIPDFNRATATLGQSLLHPPNVAGWEGGRTWITPATMLDRGNFARSVLFPDVGTFVAPDRTMGGLYRRVGQKLAQGMDITTATTEGSSAFALLANADEEYNTRYGAYHGWTEAYERVIPIPRPAAEIDLKAMARAAGASTTSEAVDYFIHRFLRVEPSASDRMALVDFLNERLGEERLDYEGYARTLEEALRGVVHLIMSLPEYQLA